MSKSRKSGSVRRKPAAAKRTSKPDGVRFGHLWVDLIALAGLGAGLFTGISVFAPDFSKPAGPAVHAFLAGSIGWGMYGFPFVLLLVPCIILARSFRKFFFKCWAWSWSFCLLGSLWGGVAGSGGWLGNTCYQIGSGAVSGFYIVLLVLVSLLLGGWLVGRSLIVPLARGTVRAAIKTGEAVVEVGQAVHHEASELAERRRERLSLQAEQQAELERKRSERARQVIAAEIEAADAPEGDSPLIRSGNGQAVQPSSVEWAETAAAESTPGQGTGQSDEFTAVVDQAGSELPDAEPEPLDNLEPADAAPQMATSKAIVAAATPEGQLMIFPSTQTGYNLPTLDLLKSAPPKPEDDYKISERSKIIERTLASFRIEAKCINAVVGPRVTRFELKIGQGINVNKIHNLADNLALELAVKAVRIEAPIPGMSAVGIEVPNATPELISLRSVIESPPFRSSNHPLTVGLGRDIAGNPIVANVAKMPHVLVAGATGSGKSVCLNALIVSLLMRNAPDTVRLILIDPKRVEMTNYQDLPHLACPVVHDVGEAQSALKWAVAEMDRRYRLLEGRRARNIAAYNEMVNPPQRLPFIVIVVDELADLMMLAGQVIEKLICRIAQLSRAVGIHLVVATQRPDVKVITGTIKANIPSRIAFATVSQIDSRTILDSGGADKLLGSGDMLFAPIGENVPIRVQGCFLADDEIDRVVSHCREQAPVNYNEEITHFTDEEDEGGAGAGNGQDELYLQAAEIVQSTQRASTSFLQRRLKIGYNRAARIMEELEEGGIVSAPDHQGNRQVI